ncbi:RagB/SusD family nutrient uptake outer membrane protein [Pedobacter sp. GR22-6]|uniref:RagB/SusD family nutrient uptake outer membrane protein n=1 Tax=Pedobacter sp. GR22-6 TaxID=3127957 RepID=UPI00307F1B31
MKHIKNTSMLWLLVVALLNFGCKKLVEVDPPLSSVTSEAVFADNITATSVISGIYTQMLNQNDVDSRSIIGISFFAGLSSDELAILPGQTDLNLQSYFKNQLSEDTRVSGFSSWGPLFGIANAATYAIEGLNAQPTKDVQSASNLTLPVKKQLLGEAKFIRAFCYFYLVNLYGDVPLILNSNFNEASKLPRSPKSDVYKQIIIDLNESKELLNVNFTGVDAITISSERVRPTRWAAAALLSRVYLYQGNDFAKAESNATEIIQNTSLFGLTALDQSFLKNTKESIWQLQPVRSGWNTAWGRYFILTGSPTINFTSYPKPFFLNESLLNSFEPGDPRKLNWTGSIVNGGNIYYYPYKYKKGAEVDGSVNSYQSMTEYMTVLRISEQYLIRAEARLMQNNLVGAAADLNAVRIRARNGNNLVLPDISPNADLTKAIAHERQVELFTEWGDRWLDLKRTGKVNEVMSTITPRKSGQDWKPHQSLYPIMMEDILKNPLLIQNPGYQ